MLAQRSWRNSITHMLCIDVQNACCLYEWVAGVKLVSLWNCFLATPASLHFKIVFGESFSCFISNFFFRWWIFPGSLLLTDSLPKLCLRLFFFLRLRLWLHVYVSHVCFSDLEPLFFFWNELWFNTYFAQQSDVACVFFSDTARKPLLYLLKASPHGSNINEHITLTQSSSISRHFLLVSSKNHDSILLLPAIRHASTNLRAETCRCVILVYMREIRDSIVK